MKTKEIKERVMEKLGLPEDIGMGFNKYGVDYHHILEDEEKKMDFDQWSVMGDGSYLPAPKAEKRLPAGLYEFEWSNRANEWCVMRQAINTDELYELPTAEIGEIINHISLCTKGVFFYTEIPDVVNQAFYSFV